MEKEIKLQSRDIEEGIPSPLSFDCSFVIKGREEYEVFSFKKKAVDISEEDFNEFVKELKEIFCNYERRELEKLGKEISGGL